VNETDELRAAVRRLLADGERLLIEAGSRSLRASGSDLADQLADQPEFTAAVTAADRAALANGYGIQRPEAAKVHKRNAGRALTANALVATGVAGWLASDPTERTATTDEVVDALAGYLAGPAVKTWRYIGIDADISRPFAPMEIAGWELVVVDEPHLEALLPLPPTARYAPHQPFIPHRWSGTVFLRQHQPDARVMTGFGIHFPGAFPERAARLPMLILSCWDPDEVVTVWSDHHIEPGRHIATRLDRVWFNTYSFDDEEVELPYTSSLGIRPPDELRFRRHCAELTALLPDETTEAKDARRLRLAANRFLAAGEHAVGTATPMDKERQPDAVFNYVAALESLVTGDKSDGAIARIVAQRSAVLAATNGADRARIYDLVGAAYSARSKWAHGDEPGTLPNIPELRAVVREVFMAWLAIWPRFGNPKRFGDACDRAIVSGAARIAFLEPIDRLRQAIAGT
jgi:hypothetical protein